MEVEFIKQPTSFMGALRPRWVDCLKFTVVLKNTSVLKFFRYQTTFHHTTVTASNSARNTRDLHISASSHIWNAMQVIAGTPTVRSCYFKCGRPTSSHQTAKLTQNQGRKDGYCYRR